MNTKRILIAAGAALALGALISPVVLHAQDEDSDGIHNQLRIMTKILEASIGEASIERRPNLSVFDSKIRTEYIPTVGAIFTIPITFPLHPSEDEKGNGTEDVVEEDLWEHFSGASENTSKAAAQAVPPVEPLDTVDIQINVDKEGRLHEQAEQLYKEAERQRTKTFALAVQDMTIYRVDGGFSWELTIGNSKPYDPVKVSTLTRSIIETIAQYGHRLKSLQNSERILVVLEAPGLRGPAKPVEVSTEYKGADEDLPSSAWKNDVGRWNEAVLERLSDIPGPLAVFRRGKLVSPFSSKEHYDRRLLAFKKSDLQQERSYDSIKGKVETTDY